MAGIQLVQNGVTFNAGGASSHPAPITLVTGVTCFLSFAGASTAFYSWTLTRPSGSNSVLSSSNSPGPTFVPDIDGGAYVVTLADSNGNAYALDVALPSAATATTASGIVAYVTTVAGLRTQVGTGTSTVSLGCYSVIGDGGGGAFDYDATDTTSTDDGGTIIVAGTRRYKRRKSGAPCIEWFGPSAANLGTAINALIQALPLTGGKVDLSGLAGAYTLATTVLVDRPIEIVPSKAAKVTATVSPAFDIADANFRMVGNDRASRWTSSSNGTLFNLRGRSIAGATNASPIVVNCANHPYVTGDYVVMSGVLGNTAANGIFVVTVLSASAYSLNGSTGNGAYTSGGYCSKSTNESNIEIRNMSLYGNGASSRCLDTRSLAAGAFSEGRLLVDNNLIGNFGTAIEFAASVYYGTVMKNTFSANGISVLIRTSANAQLHHNQFHQGSFQQIHNECFATKIFCNEFLGSAAYVSYPDIRMSTTSDGGSDGGYGYVTGNNFFGEGESFNPARARIDFVGTTSTFSTACCNIEGNFFNGVGQQIIMSASVSAGVVTASIAPQAHGIPNGNQAWVNIYNATNGTYNGKFLITSTGTSTFTYASTVASGAYGAATAVMTNAGTDGSSLSACAIRYTSPGARHILSTNSFNNYGVLIDDIQTATPAVTTAGASCNVFSDDNVISPPYAGTTQIFSRGGKGWSLVGAQFSLGAIGVNPGLVSKRDGSKLQNNLFYSEDLTNAAWTKSATVTVTAGQTGPDGKARAALISATGAAAAQDISQVFTPTNATQYVTFWAKAGPTTDGQVGDSVLCGVFDVTLSVFVCNGERLRLYPTWTMYCIPVQGINLGNFNRLSFRLAGNNQQKGSFYLAFPQIADAPGDYFPTTSAAANDTATAVRFDAPILVSQLRSQKRGSLTGPSVAGLSTGLGTGGSPQTLINAGSTDLAGTVTIQMGTTSVGTSGDLVVNFGVPYTGANAPTVILSLTGSNNNWPANSQVNAWTISNSGFHVAWTAGTATPGNAYSISYMVVGS